jgi:hypothetical protein
MPLSDARETGWKNNNDNNDEIQFNDDDDDGQWSIYLSSRLENELKRELEK